MDELARLTEPAFLLRLIHFLGAVVAVGAVIATDAVNAFVHVNPRIVRWNARITPIFSLAVWIGLIVLAITGMLLVAERPAVVNDGLFQLKLALVLVVFLNGVFVNAWVTPRYRALSDEWDENTPRVQRFTTIAAISAGISLLGWIGTVVVSYVLAN